MFGLEKLFGKEIEDVALSKDRIAEMLKVSPEALASFEQAYAKARLMRMSREDCSARIRDRPRQRIKS